MVGKVAVTFLLFNAHFNIPVVCKFKLPCLWN